MKKRESLEVVLVDDQVLVRESICLMLRARSPIQVVGEASGTREALRLLEAFPNCTMVTGIGLGEMESGIELIQNARDRYPSLPMLVLTRHSEDKTVCDALAAGANGYILKTATSAELVKAIHEVALGGSYLHPSVSLPVLRGLRFRQTEALHGERDGSGHLSHREKEILTLLSRGFNNNQMASQLHLSLSTVKTHLRTAYRKLSAVDRTQAVLKALQLRLIPELPGEAAPSGPAIRTGT